MKHKSRKFNRYFLSSALAFFVFLSAAFAAPLPEYRRRIRETKESVRGLLYSGDEKSNQAEARRSEADVLKKLRMNLPTTERVEWQGSGVEVENGWVLEKLRAFENEKDPARRAAILNEVFERLDAIETKIDELEQSAAAAASRTKDEDKQKLAEILRRAEYQKPEVGEENFLQRKWREFKEWLSRVFPRPKLGETAAAPGSQSFPLVLQIIIFALVLGIIGFLIYRFAPFLRARFKDREKPDSGVRVILGERLAADETSLNLFSEAEKMAREGNLRGAIRKGYIALLCELSDRKIIGLAQHKTNRDYLKDVRSMTELHRNMSAVTGSFERHWYGLASTEEKDWEEFRQKYRQTVSSKQ